MAQFLVRNLRKEDLIVLYAWIYFFTQKKKWLEVKNLYSFTYKPGGAREDSWESLGQQGDQTNQSERI